MILGLPFFALLAFRRQLEQREAIRTLSEAMEQSHSALMIVDLESCIEYANRGLCNQIGYSRRELIGRKWRDFQVAETPPEMLAELVSTVRSGKSWEGEWFNRRKDGVTYPVHGVITPVKGRDGGVSGFVAVFDDMTEIKLTIRCTLKCVVLPVFNLNADLWTSKGSHQKFLGVG
jgi:PAS domain S-box-containing protein